MAFTGKTDSLIRPPGGGLSDFVERLSARFNGTALSMEVPVGLARILPGSTVQPIYGTAAPGHIEQVWIGEATGTADGGMAVDSDGEITINRQVASGSPITDLEVWVQLVGPSKEY